MGSTDSVDLGIRNAESIIITNYLVIQKTTAIPKKGALFFY
jgi:hypothetical protein